MDCETKIISFDGQGLRVDTSIDAEEICKKLVGLNVEILILQGNTFGVEAAERIGLELASQPELKEAHFKDLFTSRGKEEVPEALGYLLTGIKNSGAQLTLLDLSDNAIGPLGAPSIVDFLNSQAADSLEKLYLNNCGLGPEGSTTIAATLSKLKKLREFICGRNRLEDKGAANVSSALSELKTIQLLRLNQNGIRVDGIIELSRALLANKDTLCELDLSDNTVLKKGAEAVAKFIRKAESLHTIRLDDSLLQNEGFSVICEALSFSPSLTVMKTASFEGNELHGHKIVDLIELTFRECQPSFTLNLLENEFSEEELNRFEHIGRRFEVLVDDPSDEDYEEEEETEENDSSTENVAETNGNGFMANGRGRYHEAREIFQDFIAETKRKPLDQDKIHHGFLQVCGTDLSSDTDFSKSGGFKMVQILSEELGLIKCEETRKKMPLARDAIIYIGKHLDELSPVYRDFFEAVVKNNDELDCGKLLFDQKLYV